MNRKTTVIKAHAGPTMTSLIGTGQYFGEKSERWDSYLASSTYQEISNNNCHHGKTSDKVSSLAIHIHWPCELTIESTEHKMIRLSRC